MDFNCNEKFTHGHKCKHLFLIQAIEEEMQDEVIENSEKENVALIPNITHIIMY